VHSVVVEGQQKGAVARTTIDDNTMKNVPLIGNMSRDGSSFSGGGFGQLLNDEEGTECVIEEHRQRLYHNGNDPSDEDQQYHHAMCGQAFISKVIGHGSKKTKAFRGKLSLSPNRNPMFYLRKNNTKSSLGYHETFSLEQPQDSESESGTTSHHSRSMDRLKFESSDQQEGAPPPYIVQFDPNDLTLIRSEKEQSDATKNISNGSLGSKKIKAQSILKGKHGRKSAASTSSPFCPIVLPTVTEEKSFDLQDDKSASTEPDALPSPCQDHRGANLLPSVSSTSSSSCSSFFGRVNSTEDDSRDDLENIATVVVKNAESVDLERRNETPDDEGVLDEAAAARPTSPEMMQILTAMRQIIIKQQDAIQAISNENFEFRNQLALCHEDMQIIKTESAEQLIQITQLVIQKQGLEAETARLKAELEGLRNEVSALKLQEEVDLANRFESLMGDDDEEEGDGNDDKFYAEPAVEETPERSASPTINVDKIVDDTSWRRLMSSFDSSSMDEGAQKSSPSKRHTPVKEEKSPSLNGRQWIYPKAPITLVADNEPSMANSFSSSGSGTDLLPGGSSLGSSTTTTIDRGTSAEDVVEFKSRLEEIQKKRLLRTQGPGRKSSTVRFA
jgi:hypothetical protein